MEGLIVDSAADVDSIPFVATVHSSQDAKDFEEGPEETAEESHISSKSTREDSEHEEATSKDSVSLSVTRGDDLRNPIPAVPISLMPPPAPQPTSAPSQVPAANKPCCMFSVGSFSGNPPRAPTPPRAPSPPPQGGSGSSTIPTPPSQGGNDSNAAYDAHAPTVSSSSRDTQDKAIVQEDVHESSVVPEADPRSAPSGPGAWTTDLTDVNTPPPKFQAINHELEAQNVALRLEAATAKKRTGAAILKADESKQKEIEALKEFAALEEAVVPGLHALTDGLTAALGSPPELTTLSWEGPLLDVVTSSEEQMTKAKSTLENLQEVLVSFHKCMFPRDDVPSTLDALTGVFQNMNVLAEFSQEQTLSGAETVLTLTRAHVIEGEFKAALSGPSVDSSRQEVDLDPYTEDSVRLAHKLLAMLEARAKAAQAAKDALKAAAES